MAAQSAQPIIECMAQQLMTPIEGMQNGKIVKMPFANAIVTKLLQEFMTAPFAQKLKAMVMFEGLGVLDLHKLNLQEEAAEENPGSCFSEEDRRLLEIVNQEVFGGGRDTA